MMNRSFLRILDANYNRAKEALRVAEDVARYHLADAKLTARFKRTRHDLTKGLLALRIQDRKLVEARNSKEDVGAKSFIQDKKSHGWKDLLISNLKRAEEAARVLEELSKMARPGPARTFQAIRFRLYDLEKESLRKF